MDTPGRSSLWIRVSSHKAKFNLLLNSELFKIVKKNSPHCLHGKKFFYFCRGELAEWSIAAVLKTVEGHTSGGSNPSLSARTAKPSKFFLTGFFVSRYLCGFSYLECIHRKILFSGFTGFALPIALPMLYPNTILLYHTFPP